MALKEMFQAMKKEGYVTAPLDRYLFEQANKPNDRAVNVNAPSQAGKCNRANFYMRMQYEDDGSIDPRTQRIFDNGTYTHERLQSYLIDMELLLMDEVPLINDQYNIQGHTDGFLNLEDEVAILEIKSINDNQFTQLKDAKEEHKKQGLIYLFCAEERRLWLHEQYKTPEEFNASYGERYAYFEERYQHMKGGRKFTREQKIKNEVLLNMLSDNILFYTDKPITKVIFLYENKNNQELKEFVVERNITTEPILKEVLADYAFLNNCVVMQEKPDRPQGATKSCQMCRWCSYKNECFIQ